MPLNLFRGQGPVEPVTDLAARLPAIDRSALRSAQQYIADPALRQRMGSRPVVGVLEGGYRLDLLAAGVVAHIRALS